VFVSVKLFQPILTDSSFVRKFVNYGQKQFYKIEPRSELLMMMFSSLIFATDSDISIFVCYKRSERGGERREWQREREVENV